uniref:40S ribosomal protein S27 n=1 Tax=Astatotilapia calliptera TaxID=8154 RepID=A0AAX7TP03_ASTCA
MVLHIYASSDAEGTSVVSFPEVPPGGCRGKLKHKLTKLAKDLLHPSPEEEKRRHKKKRLVQSPNSYFMDVKCPGCYKITTVFSHAQTVVLCVGCSTVLCQPTGGKARLTEGCSFRRKQH